MHQLQSFTCRSVMWTARSRAAVGGGVLTSSGFISAARIRRSQSVPPLSRSSCIKPDPGLFSGNPDCSKGFTWRRTRERSAEETLSVSRFPPCEGKGTTTDCFFRLWTQMRWDAFELHVLSLCANKMRYLVIFPEAKLVSAPRRAWCANTASSLIFFFLNISLHFRLMSYFKWDKTFCPLFLFDLFLFHRT